MKRKWLKAAGVRALKTFAQTAAATIVVGSGVNEVNWIQILSVSTVAAICSLLTSLAGLPEISQSEQ